MAYAGEIGPLAAEEQLQWLVTQHAKEPAKLAKELAKTAGLSQTGASGLAGFLTTPTLADHVQVLTAEQLAAEIAAVTAPPSG